MCAIKRIVFESLWMVRIAGVSAVMGAMAASAQVELIFQQGLGGYEGTHDTFYMTGDPLAINYESAVFEWDGEDAGGLNFGMLRFDGIFGGGANQISPDDTILGAVLTLVVENEGSPGATVHQLLFPFDETLDFLEFGDGAGFDPRPGIDYAEEPVAVLEATPGSDLIASGAVLEIDVTESIRAYQGGDDNLGWVFLPGGTNGVGIHSSEAASDRPKLTVTIEGVAVEGTRSVAGNVIPGQTLSVDIALSLAEGAEDVTIKETVPEGWSAGNISDGGALADGVITWNLEGFSGAGGVSYELTVPDDPSNRTLLSGTVNGLLITGLLELQRTPVLYESGNVLAVGVWNDNNGSSDLAVTAELTDNNGVVYARDSGAEGGWPADTEFRWRTVFFDDGFGGEEPGWRERGFDDGEWNDGGGVGFTVGHGGNDSENGEILLDPAEETVYTRSIFDAVNYETITSVILRLSGDDEAVAWLNGTMLAHTASGTSDRGETPEDYVFDTTIAGGSGGHESGTNPSDYSGGGNVTETFDVYRADAPSPVLEWALY